MADITSAMEMDDDYFVDLLGKLIGETKHLQNNPPELVPCEDRGAIKSPCMPRLVHEHLDNYTARDRTFPTRFDSDTMDLT